MKTRIKTLKVLLTAFVVMFNFSCKKDKENEVPKPSIILKEVGYNNSKIGYIGSDLHVEAEITAEAKIRTVKLEIHSEANKSWHIDTIYNEFSGMKNATFHKHIEMPKNLADTGNYHLHLIVTDMNGNQSQAESEFQIKKPNDNIPPSITIANAPSNGQVFSNGQIISISGTITDNISLAGIYVGLVKADQGLSDAQVNATNTITLLHNHEFINPTTYNFSASITVGASMDNNTPPKPINWVPGDYYILVKCKDTYGGNFAFSQHYPIVIN